MNEIVSYYSEFFKELSLLINKFLFIALPIIILGYIIGKLVKIGIKFFFKNILGLDYFIKKKKLEEVLLGINITKLIAEVASYYVYIYSLTLALKVLELKDIYSFFNYLLVNYYKIVAFIFIMLFGLAFSENIKREIEKANIDFSFKRELANSLKFIIIYMFLLVSLEILGIPTNPLYEILRVVLYTIAGISIIGLGLGIGLALKEEIRPYIREYLKKKFGNE